MTRTLGGAIPGAALAAFFVLLAGLPVLRGLTNSQEIALFEAVLAALAVLSRVLVGINLLQFRCGSHAPPCV
jgi:hypothetical protein